MNGPVARAEILEGALRTILRGDELARLGRCEEGPVASMPALRLLTWLPRLGPKGAVRLLRQVGVVGELRQVRHLTDRQRLALAARLRDRGRAAA